MKKFFPTTFCIASLALVIRPAALAADDKFILQPKMQPVVVGITESDPGTTSDGEGGLVLQPSKTEAAQPTTTAVVGGDARLPAQQAIAPLQPNAQIKAPDFGDPFRTESPNGLLWVKRGSQSALVSAIAKNPEPNTILPDVPPPIQRSTKSLETTAPSTLPVKTVSTVITPAPNQENVNPFSTANGSNHRARAQLASKISKKILNEDTTQKQILSGGSSLMGPAAIEQELTLTLSRSEQLCRRGVFLSARDEAKSAELQLARYLDSISNTFQSEPKLQAARVALREASDFSKEGAAKILPELISAHDTPVLKDVELKGVSPSVLKQSYYQFAENMLLEGAQQHPWFSDIFYSLGRTFQAEADNSASEAREMLRAQAVVYYRASSAIRPNNALATNQLGYVLLQLDRPADAIRWLIPSVDAKLDLPALQNLAEASRRVGDSSMQRWALGQIESLRRQNPQPKSRTPDILELDNSAFAATTPIVPFSSTGEARTANNISGNLR